MLRTCTQGLLAFALMLQTSSKAEEISWIIDDPVFYPGPAGSFDEVAVKDPSIVRFEEKWHLFYTARSQDEYTTGYVSAPRLSELSSAPRYELEVIRGKSRYGCAPQVFYFSHQQLWYLVFQTRDANYQPAYSTTADIDDPDSWGSPRPLLQKDSSAKWIDFWVICDQEHAFLFYTQAHQGVMVRTTQLEQFPTGWSDSRQIFAGVHEAVHIYRVRGKNQYHMVYELNENGIRRFGLATAERLAGPWRRVTDRYASGGQLRFADEQQRWTEMVSHGETLRSGYDQRLEYEPDSCRWLIQGIHATELETPYPMLPWRLGVIQRTSPATR